MKKKEDEAKKELQLRLRLKEGEEEEKVSPPSQPLRPTANAASNTPSFWRRVRDALAGGFIGASFRGSPDSSPGDQDMHDVARALGMDVHGRKINTISCASVLSL